MTPAGSEQFYLDHNASAGIAGHLRAHGHGARTARDLRLDRARDPQHLLTAARHGCLLITSDWHDFRLLHDAWSEWPPAWGIDPLPQHAGILVIPPPVAAPMPGAIPRARRQVLARRLAASVASSVRLATSSLA